MDGAVSPANKDSTEEQLQQTHAHYAHKALTASLVHPSALTALQGRLEEAMIIPIIIQRPVTLHAYLVQKGHTLQHQESTPVPHALLAQRTKLAPPAALPVLLGNTLHSIRV